MVINLCLHLLEIAGLGKSRQACSGNVLSSVLLTSLMVWYFFLFFLLETLNIHFPSTSLRYNQVANQKVRGL